MQSLSLRFPLALWALVFGLSAQTATSVVLSVSPNPSVFGAPVTLTASVSAGATGVVTFYDDVAPVGMMPVSAGTASFSTMLLPAGSRKLKAYYGGDGGHLPATSNVVTQVVNAGFTNGFIGGVSPALTGSKYPMWTVLLARLYATQQRWPPTMWS